MPCDTSKLIVKKLWGHALLSVKYCCFVQNHHDIVELDCLKKEEKYCTISLPSSDISTESKPYTERILRTSDFPRGICKIHIITDASYSPCYVFAQVNWC